MIDLNLILSPNSKMLFHLDLFLKTFKMHSNIDYFSCSIFSGPKKIEKSSVLKIKKIVDNVEIEEYSKSEFGFDPPYLGGIQRWQDNCKSDVSILADVDMIICGDISDVVRRCNISRKVMGVLNIGSPFRFYEEPSIEIWKKIEQKFEIKFNYVTHNGAKRHLHDENHFLIPDIYMNYGFILVPNEYKKSICQILPSIIKKIHDGNFWTGEVAFCIALKILNIPIETIDLKYNFPDRQQFFHEFNTDDVRVLHMVAKTIQNKYDLKRSIISPSNSIEKFIQCKVKNLFKQVKLI
jgi:hypothetical protein